MQMHKRSDRYSHFIARLLLAIIWILGIFLGLFLAISLPEHSIIMVRGLTQSRVSLIGLIGNVVLPVIFSALIWRLNLPLLYLLLAFLKSICYGFCISAIACVFQEAGWLLRWLFLFSDTCSSALLLWFWYRNLAPTNHKGAKDLYISGVIATGVILLDICCVIPFSQRIF